MPSYKARALHAAAEALALRPLRNNHSIESARLVNLRGEICLGWYILYRQGDLAIDFTFPFTSPTHEVRYAADHLLVHVCRVPAAGAAAQRLLLGTSRHNTSWGNCYTIPTYKAKPTISKAMGLHYQDQSSIRDREAEALWTYARRWAERFVQDRRNRFIIEQLAQELEAAGTMNLDHIFTRIAYWDDAYTATQKF